MPNNSDDPLNAGQQPWQGQASFPPGTPLNQMPIRQSRQKSQQQHSPPFQRVQGQGQHSAGMPAAQAGNNSPEQQAIILSAQPGQQARQRPVEAEAVETRRQAEPPVGAGPIAYSGTEGAGIAAMQPQRASQQRDQYGTFEYVLVGIVIVLIIAIIAAGISFFLYFSKQGFDPANLERLFPYLLIYVLCVFAGVLWGRYQLDTQAKKNSEQLQLDVNRLQMDLARIRNERASLQDQLYKTQSDLATLRNAPPPVVPSVGRTPSQPLVNVVKSPEQIGRIQPGQSIHDVTRDPPDFNEYEQREHPHEKFYPTPGIPWKLRSGWNVIGASRRGYGHSYEGKYREDDFEIRSIRADTRTSQVDMVMVAIADGVSSKPYSRRGARAAVQGALSITDTSVYVQELRKSIGEQASSNVRDNAAFKVLMESLQAAHAHIEQQGKYYRISVDEMHSTLMVYIAIPVEQQLFVASVQVGDGALFAMRPGGATPRERWRWLQQPQIQATGNEVQPFMRTGPEVWQQYLRADLLDNPSFIMGMTDGTADDIEAPRPTQEVPNPDPFYFVDDFYQHIAQSVIHAPQPAEALLKFLDYKKKQSFDDRTVVCLYR